MIDTDYMRIEDAAVELGVPIERIWTAALENILRLWVPLHEWRDFEARDYSTSRGEHDYLSDGRGREYFDFVPLIGAHVTALLTRGEAAADVLSEVDQIVKVIPDDEPQKITVVVGGPLYVRAGDVQRLKVADEVAESPPVPTPAPGKGAHVSDQLAAVNQAAAKFWTNVYRDDPSTHPTNAQVAAWLHEKRGFSPSLADKAATIIRPEWAPVGRKPEK